jgi:nitrogen regulatory protein P-II 2
MFSRKKLLTVVCEGALESRLIRDLLALGAKGYTVTDAHGTGPRNQRNADLEGGNIRLEVVTDELTLTNIIERLQRDYFPNYAVSVWVADVEVLRQERY